MSPWNQDKMKPAQDRGWAVVQGDEIMGDVFVHQWDESEFKAKKERK